MPLITTSAQGNDQAPGEELTHKETLLGEALFNVLVAAGMLRADAHVSPPELLMAADDYVTSQAAQPQG